MRAFGGILEQSPAISQEAARRELRAAFEAWEAAANVTFVEVDDPSTANIVVGAQGIPEGKAFANLSYRSSRLTAPVAKALGQARPAAFRWLG